MMKKKRKPQIVVKGNTFTAAPLADAVIALAKVLEANAQAVALLAQHVRSGTMLEIRQ